MTDQQTAQGYLVPGIPDGYEMIRYGHAETGDIYLDDWAGVPDGYEVIGFREPKKGETYLVHYDASEWSRAVEAPYDYDPLCARIIPKKKESE